MQKNKYINLICLFLALLTMLITSFVVYADENISTVSGIASVSDIASISQIASVSEVIDEEELLYEILKLAFQVLHIKMEKNLHLIQNLDFMNHHLMKMQKLKEKL